MRFHAGEFSGKLRALKKSVAQVVVDGPGVFDEDGCSRFAEEVCLWNAKLDLTAAKDMGSLVDILFADAWVLAQVLPRGMHVLDVGSGAGAPALPLMIFRPDLRCTLLEPKQKRVAFMRTVVGKHELRARVEVIEGRVEPESPMAPTSRLGGYDAAMARATFAPSIWLACGAALAPRVIVFAVDESDIAEGPELGTQLSPVHYEWPGSHAKRVLLQFDVPRSLAI